MIYFSVFILSFILNDGRILYKVFGNNLQFIKYKIVLQELGLEVYLFLFLLNLLKGFFPLLIVEGEFSKFVLALILLLGNFLGAKPGKTGGSELVILWGIWLGFNFNFIQTPLAIFLGIWLITAKFKLGFWLASNIVLIKLLYIKCYPLFLLSSIILVNYGLKECSHFWPLLNKLKEKVIFTVEKGVKI